MFGGPDLVKLACCIPELVESLGEPIVNGIVVVLYQKPCKTSTPSWKGVSPMACEGRIH